ncbi:hypothetical protein BCV70DRAFT_47796 [Testicularia cyperi]|uniref:Uncharacterized protein n=1 Tax=Testicularia cyperi TaxID=1882483 RepID=A0A317XI25_9BASI|nr:hypothetical protein BCV70DRAFT_47796 [Testicularia cyperi]
MWAGSSPSWRKRFQSQPLKRSVKKGKPKPRIGINTKPSSSSRTAAGADRVPAIMKNIWSLYRRQDELDAGADAESPAEVATDGLDAADAEATFNDGMWTPPASVTAAILTPSFTATVGMASLTPTPTSEASVTESLSSSVISESVSASSASFSRSSSSAASTSTASKTANPSDRHASSGFKIVYLTPVFIFLGLMLIFTLGGRVWGRVHHASRVEAARRTKREKRLSKEAKKAEMRRIKTMWGYAQTPMLPAEPVDGQDNDIFYTDPNKPPSSRDGRSKLSGNGADGDSSIGSDSDTEPSVSDKYPGTLKILSLALLGEGSKPEPPVTRQRTGTKYEEVMQSNSWLAVKLRRWIGRDENDGFLSQGGAAYTEAPSRGLAQQQRRLRKAMSQNRMRVNASDETLHEDVGWKNKAANGALSPATTLSVGSAELDEKVDFSPGYATIDLSRTQQAASDPFYGSHQLGLGGYVRKPLPPQPQESPYRPSPQPQFLAGLRSRSKQYENIPAGAAAAEPDTPRKASASGLNGIPKGFGLGGLGITGVWRAVASFGGGLTGGRHTALDQDDEHANSHNDEESFLGRPYKPHSDVMSECDTPYENTPVRATGSPYRAASHVQASPSKGLMRNSTVLQVKSRPGQPWNPTPEPGDRANLETPGRTMTAAKWNEAVLSSPVNRTSQQPVFQPFPGMNTNTTDDANIAGASPAQDVSQPRPHISSTGVGVHRTKTLASVKSMSRAQMLAAKLTSPAFTDYSDLVACYSTPSSQATGDDLFSPEVADARVPYSPSGHARQAESDDEEDERGNPGIRTISTLSGARTADLDKEQVQVGRSKLQRAMTAKFASAGLSTHELQRSKTASTAASSSDGNKPTLLARRPTVHHSKARVPELQPGPDAAGSGSPQQRIPVEERGRGSLYPYSLTQPLRLTPKASDSPVLPARTSSSPRRPGCQETGLSSESAMSTVTRQPQRIQLSNPVRPTEGSEGGAGMPSSLMIASPEAPTFQSRHRQQLSYDVSAAYVTRNSARGYANFSRLGLSSQPAISTSAASATPPRRANAISPTRAPADSILSPASQLSDSEGIVFDGRAIKQPTPAQKAKNRSNALAAVNDIVHRSYAATSSSSESSAAGGSSSRDDPNF